MLDPSCPPLLGEGFLVKALASELAIIVGTRSCENSDTKVNWLKHSPKNNSPPSRGSWRGSSDSGVMQLLCSRLHDAAFRKRNAVTWSVFFVLRPLI